MSDRNNYISSCGAKMDGGADDGKRKGGDE